MTGVLAYLALLSCSSAAYVAPYGPRTIVTKLSNQPHKLPQPALPVTAIRTSDPTASFIGVEPASAVIGASLLRGSAIALGAAVSLTTIFGRRTVATGLGGVLLTAAYFQCVLRARARLVESDELLRELSNIDELDSEPSQLLSEDIAEQKFLDTRRRWSWWARLVQDELRDWREEKQLAQKAW